MQKGVFTTWIKELCALVFVQTIQAFILAIVLSIILTFIKDNGSKVSEQATVQSLGVLCIILLTSLTKMEQITKKIFGLDSGLLQNKPPHGLMASYMALKAAGRIFNNIPKMAGGIGNIIGAGTDKKKANAKMLTRLNKKGIDKNGNPIGSSPQINAPTGENNLLAGESNLLEGNEYYEKAKQAKKNGDMDGYRENMGIQAGINKAKKEMAQNATVPSRLNKSAAVGMDISVPKSRPQFEKDAEKIMDAYDDEIAKAKEKRRQGIQKIVSGAAETVGAGIGGMAGLSIGSISGLATGDIDQVPKAMAYGIGAGDALGENLTKAVSSVAQGAKARAKASSNLDKQLSQMENTLKIQNNKRESQAKRTRAIMQKMDKNSQV